MMVERKRGTTNQRNRQRVLKRDNGLCVHCMAAGKVSFATEVDHKVPLCKGGTDSDDNKQSLCHACHSVKTARDLGKRPRNSVGVDGMPIGDHHWNR